MIDINNIGGDIKLKTRNELIQKEFMESKDNKYRVKKLIKLTESLKNPDIDIELDEMKFTKLKKYRDYSLVKLTLLELKKILANYSVRDNEETFLNFLGISKLNKDVYSLQLDIYVDKFIKINLKEITFEENLDLIFRMFDTDNNGKITKNEALDLISFFHQSNSLGFDEETLGHLTDVIFKQIDKSNQGFISRQSLSKYLEIYKDEDITINPFTKVKTSDAVTRRKRLETQKISSEEEKVLERINRKKDRSKLWKFWVLNKKMIIWSIIFFGMCLVAGLINRSLEGGRQYGTTKAARFFAGIIFFCLACLIVYMCDAPITFLSSTFLKYYLPLNDPKHYHTVCGVVLAVATIPHVLIHIFGDFSQIAAICAKNPKKSYVTVAWLTFANLTGITGVISLIIFSVMIIVPFIQRILNKRYELFLHTHKLFYLAMVVLFLHARTPDTKRWPYVVFLGFPLLLFIIELLIRVVRYFLFKSKILRVKFLQSGVILLELHKPKYFKFRCGQYAQINIPKISKFQWHPFTFASSPNDDSLFFYINPVGDWTSNLKKLSNNDPKILNSNKEPLLTDLENIVHIDGPHGAPAEHFNNYDNLIMIASGVGVTPFSSILIGLLYKLKKREVMKHKSISFYWIQREYEKTDYLKNILEEIAVEDVNRLFDINIFITCAQQKYDMRSLFLADGIELCKKDARGRNFSQLCSGNVFWGRPEWDEIFKKKTLKFRKPEEQINIGVFVCGNNSLVDDIYEVCENYSSAAVKFELNTEHF